MGSEGWPGAGLTSSLQLPAMDIMASAREISFRRLMYSTEQQLANCRADTPANEPLEFSPSVAKLRHCMTSLEDQLADLDRMQGALRLSSEKLALYRQHVKHLAAQLPAVHVPQYCQRPAQKAAVPASLLTSHLSGASNRRSSPGGGGGALGGPAMSSNGGGGVTGLVGGLSATARSAIETQQALQEDQTDELVAMTGALKASTIALQEAVRARGDLVDTAEVALDKSLASAHQVVKKSKEQYKRSSGGFCLTCMILMVVGLVFTCMAVYVKLTWFAGYRAGKPIQNSGGGFSSWTKLIPGQGNNDEL